MQADEVVQLFRDEAGTPPRVGVRGEIDLLHAPDLRACLEEALKTQPAEIVVDMTRLTFIDSSGLNALIFAERMLREGGGHLVVANPPRTALRVMEVAGLTEVFTIRRQDNETTGPAATQG